MYEYTSEGVAEYVHTLFDVDFKGVCIDIGANDPFWLSNSWLFEHLGWDCYCIEPNPHCIERLKFHRENVLEYAVGKKNEDNVPFFIYTNLTSDDSGPNRQAGGTGLIDFTHMKDWPKEQVLVKTRTFNWIMEHEIGLEHIDFLSIDVEGSEQDVLSTVDLSIWKPKVVVIENLFGPPFYMYEENWIPKWFEERGYKLINRIKFNDIYIKE
jgi:FkbM family methyltransferase